MILGHLITSYDFNEKWNNTNIVIFDEYNEKVFELIGNAFLSIDKKGFINNDNEFTNEIYKYEILSIEFFEDMTIIKIKNEKKEG